MEGSVIGVKSEGRELRSFENNGRGRSLIPKASHDAGNDIENAPASGGPEGSQHSDRPQYGVPSGVHYGTPGISPQAAAMAATTAASGSYHPYQSGPREQGVRSQSPKIGVTLQRARSPMSPQHEKTLHVNAKQLHRILKRRVARQKLEEALRLTSKGRKPYIHVPRQNHQMQRRKGPGGRVLTADEVAELERTKKGGDKKEDKNVPPFS